MLPCIMGMIVSGLMIVFNEPLAKASLNLTGRIIGIPITAAILYRAKVSFILYGTLYMIVNAIVLKWLFLA
jgi:hypothetical protein